MTTQPGRKTTSRRSKTSGTSIDEYLAALPPDQLRVLSDLRRTIRELVPNATEEVTYRCPTIVYHGPLVGFSAARDHCSFFVMSHAVMGAFREELELYYVGPGTLRFSPSAPIPEEVIRAIVVARMRENEANASAKR